MGQKSVGHFQATGIDAAVDLKTAVGGTIPATADFCTIQADTQDVRIRHDGTAPTASVGTLLKVGATTLYVIRKAQFGNTKIISAVAGAKANIEFFKTG